MSPLLPREGSAGSRVWQSACGLVFETVIFLLVTVLFPILLLAAGVSDLAAWVGHRKPWVGVRLVAMLWWFMAGEMRGLLGVGWIWLRSGPWRGDTAARRRRIFRIQATWAAGHLLGVRKIFGLRFEVEGDDLVAPDAQAPAPVLVFIRHASIIDNALPAALISLPHHISLRYVLKRELQSLQTLNIGGPMIPTCFVRRASDNPDREVANVRTLGERLGVGDGVLIYPEGTRFTPQKLARAQEKIAASDPDVARYSGQLRNLLPPRLGGPLALLDEASGADVVVCGHVGLDGFEKISDIWQGGLVGATVRVRFWRHARSEVPSTEVERIAWIYDRWLALDRWVGDQHEIEAGPQAHVAASVT